MKKSTLMGLALISAVLFLTVSAFAQTETKLYQGKEVAPEVIRVKFKNDPVVMQKMEAAHISADMGMRSIASKASNQPVVIAGLTQLNNLNKAYSAVEMTRVFRPAGIHESKHRAFGLHLWYEIKYQPGADIDDILKSYAQLEYVQTVNPRYIAKTTGTLPGGANDPRLGDQWHYENNGGNGGTADADIDLEEAWTIETGNSNVVVAIEDGGIDVDHEDLIGNMWVNPGEIAGNGLDDDANGFIDDVHGFNFVANSGTIEAHNHGTHVAGTVGAETNNGIGGAGVAGGTGSNDGVRLMSCQVFSSTGQNGFAEAFTYAADNGAVISQNSWGYTSPGVFDQAVLDGIDYFIANAGGAGKAMIGGLVAIAAGNSNNDGQYYPGYYAPSLAVSAVNNQDKKSWYTNYGTWVDIAAPGGETNVVTSRGVLSTTSNNTYSYYQGTSMACPHVSGVAALVISKNYGNITAAQLRTILVTNVDPVDPLNPGFVGKLGSGRLNAFKALSAGDTTNPPGKATNPSPANAATNVTDLPTLTWNSGAGANSHNVHFGTTNPPASIGNQTSTSYSPDTLSLNTTYYWRIDEVNSNGTTVGDVWSFTTKTDPGSGEYAKLPYNTGFESGSVDSYWALKTENTFGRLQVTTANSPNGSYHLTSDVTTNGNYSTNEAWLKVDLSGQTQVELSFNWKEFSDEDNTEDGVFLSDNGGSTFKKVHNLTGGTTTYSEIKIDIDQVAATNGLSLTDKFVIKFQHRDNYSITTDGFAYDDISVKAPSAPPTGYDVNLVLVFDNYPEETSWEIKNSAGTVVESGGTYGSEPDGSTKTIAMKLEATCYDLTMKDSYGDGMCCSYGNGKYELLQGTNLLASGASFTTSETKNFCVTATSGADITIAEGVSELIERKQDLKFEVYPNPVVDYLVINSELNAYSTYSIRDLAGKTIINGDLVRNETYVDMSQLSAGMYLIDLSINGENQTLKIIKR